MALYNREVAEVLGDDVVQELKRCVTEVKLLEIARELHSNVGGDQMRRKRYDASAMAEVLSDW